MDTETIITRILAVEGGFVNKAEDRGGPTKFGITRGALALWRGKDATLEDVINLTMDEAREIYRNTYVKQPRFDRIPEGILRTFVVDCGVNHGTERATKWLQDILGLKQDGDFGPKTTLAVQSCNTTDVFLRMCGLRMRYYGKLIDNDPERVRATRDGYKLQAIFAEGWTDRVADFLDEFVGYHGN